MSSSLNDYIQDLYQRKIAENLTWEEISSIIEETTGEYVSPEAVRKRVSRIRNRGGLDAQLLEKKKLADERTQVNAIYRRIAREDTLKEIAFEYANSLEKIYKLPTYNGYDWSENKEKNAVLLISDWHYGIEVDNVFNFYNPMVCRERVSLLQNKVISYLNKEGINHIDLLNLGDMIAGRIHLPIRLNSRIDVITQIMEVSELLAQFMSNLSQYASIDYYSTLDNHSRLEPNIKDSIDLESLVRITDWFLKERLKDNIHIEFHSNKYGDDIISFEELGHKVVGVHGHKDKPNKIIDSLSMFTQTHYDMICAAHFHHFNCDEKNETVLISNSSLMGTDDFAENLRLNSKPSQVMIISTKENVCENIYKINLE